jgi:hypothetical protein
MGFITTGITVNNGMVVYLTPTGAEYLAGKKKTISDLGIKYFSLGDSDCNYNVLKKLGRGYVPDLTGEDPSCLRIANITIDNKKFYNDWIKDTNVFPESFHRGIIYNKVDPPPVIIYSNVEKYGEATRNNCGTDLYGDTPYRYTVPAGKYTSTVSQADVDEKAQNDVNENTQAQANLYGECVYHTFWNVAIALEFYKNDCGVGQTGTAVTYTCDQHVYSAHSQAEADALALADVMANGQAYANLVGECSSPTLFWNASRSQDFTKNNCGDSMIGGTGNYTVSAGIYSSVVSQADADAQADADMAANGQNYVNSIASCTPVTYPFKWVIDDSASYCEVRFAPNETGIIVVDIFGANPNSTFAARINTVGVTIPDGNLAYKDMNFIGSTDAPQNAWMLASDYVQQGNALTWRFEFNVAKLMTFYPNITDFTMEIIGKEVSAKTLTGSYVLKGADQGNMTMVGSEGSYIPSVQLATNLGIVSTSYNVSGGANGTYDNSLPVVKTFVYHKATRSMTVS